MSFQWICECGRQGGEEGFNCPVALRHCIPWEEGMDRAMGGDSFADYQNFN